jgi:hypothetical protein
MKLMNNAKAPLHHSNFLLPIRTPALYRIDNRTQNDAVLSTKRNSISVVENLASVVELRVVEMMRSENRREETTEFVV